MKANAPENIYLHVRANKELGTTWHGKKITNSDIEYTRTDAFIEKAVNWLINNTDITPTGIKNFRKAMKGE